MATKGSDKKKTDKAPNRSGFKPPQGKARGDETGNLEELIEELIKKLRARLKKVKSDETEPGGVHSVVADLTKILQLRKEVTPERPKEVTVRWVEEKKDEGEA